MNFLEIFCDYTSGRISLEEANKQMVNILNRKGYGIFLVEKDHSFSEEERKETVSDKDPSKVNGYGLLDVGDCIIRKVRVINGILQEYNIDETVYALIIIGGRYYEVKGNKLVNI